MQVTDRSFDPLIENVFPAQLSAARDSDSMLGTLLQSYRDYLLLVANKELPADVRPKVAPSDIVQETFVEAREAFAEFPGIAAHEFRAWLKRILINNTKDAIRHYRVVQKRQVSRELSLEATADAAMGTFPGRPVADPSPSQCARLHEDRVRLTAALERLPESHRQVIELRNFEQLSFVEIGERTQRTASAARALWIRAIRQLAQNVGSADES